MKTRKNVKVQNRRSAIIGLILERPHISPGMIVKHFENRGVKPFKTWYDINQLRANGTLKLIISWDINRPLKKYE